MNHREYQASVPSNIALIKYWGKREGFAQWPANDSIAMTLDAARTDTTARVIRAAAHELWYKEHQLFETDPFAKKTYAHLRLLAKELGFSAKLRINSSNTFPAGCGIASSASGMGALTLAAIAAWTESSSLSQLEQKGFSLAKMALLARLGSGSACRSLFGGYTHWQAGESAELQNVSQIQTAESWPLCNLIIIINAKPKSVSSTQGHAAAWHSPLFAPRLAAIPERIKECRRALQEKDFTRLGWIMELEATELHAVALSGRPVISYLQPETSEFLAWLRRQRTQGGIEAYFTIDAGPNVHVICKPEDADRLSGVIAEKFPHYEILKDRVGQGPRLSSPTEV